MDRNKKGQNRFSDFANQNKIIERLMDEKHQLEKQNILIALKLEFLKRSTRNLNHDLRSPLGGITGMIDLLLADGSDTVEVHSGDLKMIKHSAQSILDLLNGKLPLKGGSDSPSPVINIESIISSTLLEISRLYLPMSKAKGIKLSLRTEIESKLRLHPNYFHNLIQITGNLVANAIKFTPPGGNIDVHCTLSVDHNHPILSMKVTDNGQGMPPDQVSAFNLGYPVARSTGTNGEKGFGIGLQHVIQMVAEERGHISVTSENGRGTEFSISFPLTGNRLTRTSLSQSLGGNDTASTNGRHD